MGLGQTGHQHHTSNLLKIWHLDWALVDKGHLLMFFFIFLPLFLQSFMLKIYKVNRIKVCTYRSSYFQQKTLLLKCSISGPTFNFFYFVTSHYINKLYICIIYSWQLVWHVRNDSAQLLCGCERRFRCDALTKQELKQSFSDRGLQPWIVWGNRTLTLTHQTI